MYLPWACADLGSSLNRRRLHLPAKVLVLVVVILNTFASQVIMGSRYARSFVADSDGRVGRFRLHPTRASAHGHARRLSALCFLILETATPTWLKLSFG